MICLRLMITDRDILEAALIGFQTKSAQIEAKIAQIKAQLGGSAQPAARAVQSGMAVAAAPPVAASATAKKRTMSPLARKRIAAAQKKRWADYHKKQGK